MRLLCLSLILAASLIACGDDTTPAAASTDTSTQDMSPTDGGLEDAAAQQDASSPDEVSVSDTAEEIVPESDAIAPKDSTAADSVPATDVVEDTSVMDSAQDAAVVDSAQGADAQTTPDAGQGPDADPNPDEGDAGADTDDSALEDGVSADAAGADVSENSDVPDGTEADPCEACLEGGGTWQPPAGCTQNCMIADLSCYTSSCPEPCSAESCGTCFDQESCEEQGCTWNAQGPAMWCN